MHVYVEFYTKYIGPPNYIDYWVKSRFEDVIQVLLNVFMVFFFDPRPTTHQSNTRVQWLHG